MKLIKGQCIVCRKNPQDRGLFCIKCFNKDVFIKIKAFKRLKEYLFGTVKPHLLGRLPTREERERNANT